MSSASLIGNSNPMQDGLETTVRSGCPNSRYCSLEQWHGPARPSSLNSGGPRHTGRAPKIEAGGRPHPCELSIKSADFRYGLSLIALLLLFPYAGLAQFSGDRDTDFTINVSRRTELPYGLQAEIITTSTYPCAGYSIRSHLTWEKDTISISVSGFVQPSPCISTSAEATGTVYLGNPGIGTYFVKVSYRGDVDLHRMQISKQRIRIIPLRNEFTTLNLQF